MKIGTIRRIDDLGRIVIPKTVRKTLNIKPGDNLEIYIENENIILKKHSEMSAFIETGQIISKTIKEKIKSNIYITDKDKIIIENSKQKNEKITKELQKIIENRQIEIKNSLKLADKITIKGNIIINPIISNGDILGSLIINKDSEITKEEIEIIKAFGILISKMHEE